MSDTQKLISSDCCVQIYANLPLLQGLSCVVNHLLSKKQGHPTVVLFNLREDLVIECNGATYGIRETSQLEEPIIMPGISAAEIEEKEEQLKKDIKAKKNFQVRFVSVMFVWRVM